jgi:filamin
MHCYVCLGRHSVAVILDGEPVKGSPFACNIYDVSKVKITGLGPSKVCHSYTVKSRLLPK